MTTMKQQYISSLLCLSFIFTGITSLSCNPHLHEHRSVTHPLSPQENTPESTPLLARYSATERSAREVIGIIAGMVPGNSDSPCTCQVKVCNAHKNAISDFIQSTINAISNQTALTAPQEQVIQAIQQKDNPPAFCCLDSICETHKQQALSVLENLTRTNQSLSNNGDLEIGNTSSNSRTSTQNSRAKNCIRRLTHILCFFSGMVVTLTGIILKDRLLSNESANNT